MGSIMYKGYEIRQGFDRVYEMDMVNGLGQDTVEFSPDLQYFIDKINAMWDSWQVTA